MNDTLGDLVKSYEDVESARKFDPTQPVIVRLDGKAFHTLTKGLPRPFCMNFTRWMHGITKYLVEQSDALVGYTQSDEITLVFYRVNPKREMYFGGRVQKLCSVLASMATMQGMRTINTLPEVARSRNVMFDCRAFQVPTKQLASLCLAWRVQDAYRNAINAISQFHYSHKQLLEKSSDEKLVMIAENGDNVKFYSLFNLYGTFFQRSEWIDKFTAEELEQLPAKHHARSNPDLLVKRSAVSPFPATLDVGQIHNFVFDEVMYRECGAIQRQELMQRGFP